ncbi:thermostable hemolysin [Gallaecimonas kandeliae]|uniref:thermostable hemolysin n=1 Tax=Gallaecimonas kandeliae TaxID=3029055 RepID=UPI00264703FC|nr:thermostable hemolysin [Gallaecimonas kandeliae]WKE64690.1 thermostable hemolysin [Gallaecimonas kandeliae]
MLAKYAEADVQVHLSREGTETYDRIKHFACARYADVHQARLRHFLPLQYLLSKNQQWLASCGLRNAEGQSLYLEQYLDEPIERLLAAKVGRPVARAQVVEVGNLAGEAGGARLMILALTRHLAQCGVDYVVFTATRELQSAFARLGLEPWFLADASAERLNEGAQDWGRYYQNKPAVFSGSVRLGWEAIQRQPLLMRVLANISNEVTDVV